MKKYLKKLTAALIILVMVLTSVSVSAQETNVSERRYVYAQIKVQKGYILGSFHPARTSVKIAQSKKLGTVKSTRRSDGYNWYYFYPAKPGKTTVSVTSKTGASKAEITRNPFTVLKYQNPVSSVKIGNTNISGSKFNKTDRIYLSYSKYSVKNNSIKITPKKGWTLSSLSAFDKAGNLLNFGEMKEFKAFGGKNNYILKVEFFNSKTNASEAMEIVFK